MLIAAILLGVLAVLVVGLVCAAGPIFTAYANRKLQALPGYLGSVERIEISLWQGRGEVSGATFASRAAPTTPIAQVKRLGFDLSWWKLLRGQVSIAIEIESARVLVEGVQGGKKTAPTPAGKVRESARESAQRWQEQLYAAFPFEITQIVVRDSEVTYRDLLADPPMEFQLSSLQIDVVGLSNRWAESDDGLPARLGLQGNLTGGGRVRLLVRADPLALQPRFEAKLQIEDVAVPAWNALLRDAIKADIVAGQFGCSAEISAAGGEYWGYVKPVIRDLEFKELPEEPETGWKKWRRRLMNWAVAFLGRGRRQKIATKIPFSGNFKETNVDVWTAVENLLRNAFIRGLREGLEGALMRF
jgi:hypothetical protein